MSIVSVKDFYFTYPNGKKVLDNINFELEKGEMLLISGLNGCGKTTLLRSLKKEIAPKGKKSGEIEVNGEIAYLFQECDKNVIFRSPYEDLIFYACNLGIEAEVIEKRAEEIIETFSLSDLVKRSTDTFSGGEKQTLALASLLITQPDLIILDEPFSQLDEESENLFFEKLLFAKDKLGAAIIIAEHNTDKLLEKCDKFMLFEENNVRFLNCGSIESGFDAPNLPEYIKLENKLALPYKSFKTDEAVKNIERIKEKIILTERAEREISNSPVLEVSSLAFSYGEPLLNDVNFTLKKGEIAFLTGKNGAGKSTLFKLMCSFLKPKSGKIKFADDINIGYLAQNPIYSFLKDTLKEDYEFVLKKNGLSLKKTRETLNLFPNYSDLEQLLESNPLDLSGGERAKAAMFKLLLLGKNLILLDEPEKHLDKKSTAELSEVLKSLADKGIAFLIISHTPDFIYNTADSIKFLENGKINEYNTEEYFGEKSETSLYSALKECNLPLRTAAQTEVEYG